MSYTSLVKISYLCVCLNKFDEITCTIYEVGPERTAGALHAMRKLLEVAATFRSRGGASGSE